MIFGFGSADIQRVRGVLRLRPPGGGAEEEHQGHVVARRCAGQGRHRRPRLLHYFEPQGKIIALEVTIFFFFFFIVTLTPQAILLNQDI